MERNSFIFYKSFYEAIKGLPAAQQGRIFGAVAEFALYGEEPTDLTPIENTVFVLIKPQIVANIKRYQNGCKGGRPTTEEQQGATAPEPNDNQNKTKQNQSATTPRT